MTKGCGTAVGITSLFIKSILAFTIFLSEASTRGKTDTLSENRKDKDSLLKMCVRQGCKLWGTFYLYVDDFH